MIIIALGTLCYLSRFWRSACDSGLKPSVYICDFPTTLYPKGTPENSPAVHCWVARGARQLLC